MKIGVGVEAGVTYHHLPLVGDMGCHPGDKLQIIHRLILRLIHFMTA